ncbi:MAG: tetratricopeptide repeat protein [Elusimicrobia bacterium]|nr:tetratricopeptide repeat protein [Elusimicrobiota bacterium]
MASIRLSTAWRACCMTALLSLPASAWEEYAAGSDFAEPIAPLARTRCRGSRCAAPQADASTLAEEGLKELKAGRYPEAIARLERAAAKDASSAKAWFGLGNAFHRRSLARGAADSPDKDDARAAVAAFEKGLTLDPRLASLPEPFSLYAALEECRRAVGDNEKALKDNLKAIEVSRDNFMPRLQRASLHFSREEWASSSVALYRSVLAARRFHAYPQLSRLIRQAPRFASLLELPQNKIILDTYDAVEAGDLSDKEAEAEVRDYVDIVAAAKEEDSEAASGTRLAAQAPAAAPAEPSSDLSGLKGFEVAAVQRTDGDLRDSLNDPSSSPRREVPASPAEFVRERVRQGDDAFASERLREAILAYESAMTADAMRHELPLDEEARLFERIGSAYRRLGMFPEALQALTKALSQPAKRATSYYELALYCAEKMDLDRSLSFLEKALKTASSAQESTRLARDARRDKAFASLRKLRKGRFDSLLGRAAGKS